MYKTWFKRRKKTQNQLLSLEHTCWLSVIWEWESEGEVQGKLSNPLFERNILGQKHIGEVDNSSIENVSHTLTISHKVQEKTESWKGRPT